MMAAVTRQAFRSLGNVSPSPSEIMKRAAGLLFEDLDWLEMFVTVAIGVVDLTRSEVRIANAGHCPVVVAQPDGSVKGCEPTMAPLGLERLPECLEITVPFGPGARLFAYSDGLVDPRDKRSPFESPGGGGGGVDLQCPARRPHHRGVFEECHPGKNRLRSLRRPLLQPGG